MKKVVTVLGGGTGTMAVLNGLKRYPDIDINVIVNMTDDGGSNAVVRDEFGLLPLSDLRKSIIALSNTNDELIRELFTYRFSKGNGLKGHTLGNLMMMALSEIAGSEIEAVSRLSKLFQVQGTVIPVTEDDVKLVAEYENGEKIMSEHIIDEPENPKIAASKIINLSVEPQADASKEAIQALQSSDYIVAGPGDLYTSTIANLVISGIPQALKQSKGKFIFITNLMTKLGQTHWMKSLDMVKEISHYAERKPDIVIQNSGKILPEVIDRYAEEQEYVFEDNLGESNGFKIIRADIVGDAATKKEEGDDLKRSLIRHDAEKLGKLLYGVFTYPEFWKMF